jgi:uncharacterized protein with GYD domain
MIFITQGNYTHHAMAGMLEQPEDRSVAVKKLLAKVGAKVINYYFTFGQYDFLLIGEAKDEHAWMAGLMVVGATGGVSNLTTTVAVTTAQAKQTFGTAKDLRASFRAAGEK